MAVRKRKNEKSKSETKNDDKSENDEQLQKSSSKLSIICLGKLANPRRPSKMECVYPIVIVSILFHAEFGPMDYGEGAPYFTSEKTVSWAIESFCPYLWIICDKSTI